MPQTSTGRIVYNRKPHLFRYKDVLRIVRKVEISKDDERLLDELADAAAAALAALADFEKGLALLVPERKVFWASRMALQLVAYLFTFLSFSADRAGDIAQAIYNELRNRFF